MTSLDDRFTPSMIETLKEHYPKVGSALKEINPEFRGVEITHIGLMARKLGLRYEGPRKIGKAFNIYPGGKDQSFLAHNQLTKNGYEK